MRVGINHADLVRSTSFQAFGVKEKWTVFFDFKDGGAQPPFAWKEKELITGKGLEKNAGYTAGAYASGIRGEVQTCRFVTLEAESALEATEAVTTFITRGVTNPGGSAPAVTVQGTGGGFANNKGLACKSSSLSEEVLTP